MNDENFTSKYWPQRQCQIGVDSILKTNNSESVLDFTQVNFVNKGYGYLPLNDLLDESIDASEANSDQVLSQDCSY